MRQSIVEQVVSDVTDISSDGKPTGVLMRLWNDAEQAIAAERVPPPPTHYVVPVEKPVNRVRYAYD